MKWLWRLLLLIIVPCMVWLSLGYRLNGVAPDDYTVAQPHLDLSKLEDGTVTEETYITITDSIPPLAAIPWPQRSDALIQQSRIALQQQNMEKAEKLALQALTLDITNGRAAAQLLAIYQELASIPEEKIDAVAQLASYLWPAHTFVRSYVAKYWLEQDNVENTLAEWNVLMTRNPALRKSFYPILIQLASNPATLPLLQQYINNPPRWWDSFFSTIASNPEQLPILRLVYQARIDSGVPLTAYEQRTMTNRLLRDKRWDEAYFSWLNGLNKAQIERGGYVYDGGFEGDLYNTGFDWQIGRHKMLQIRPSITQGMTGAKALRISLRKEERINFQHLSQRLFLPSGDYNFEARYRVDQLRNEKGLSWRVRCLDDLSRILGESNSNELLSRKPWSKLTFDFTIPAEESCSAQLLRLEAKNSYANNHNFEGSLWFDDVTIRPKVEEGEIQ